MEIAADKLLLGKKFKEFVKKTVRNDITHISCGKFSGRETYAKCVETQKKKFSALEKIIEIGESGLSKDDPKVKATIQRHGEIQQMVLEVNGFKFAFEEVNGKLQFMYEIEEV